MEYFLSIFVDISSLNFLEELSEEPETDFFSRSPFFFFSSLTYFAKNSLNSFSIFLDYSKVKKTLLWFR